MATPIATIQAAEVGKQLSFTQSTSGPNMTGATVKLLVTPAGGSVTQYTCTVPASGAPYYTTLGTEFPAQGNYQVQLEYINGSEKYYSPVATLKVLPNLG